MEFIKEAGVSPQKSMDIKNDKITIKPLRDKDVDIFSKWLAKEYIYKMVLSRWRRAQGGLVE